MSDGTAPALSGSIGLGDADCITSSLLTAEASIAAAIAGGVSLAVMPISSDDLVVNLLSLVGLTHLSPSTFPEISLSNSTITQNLSTGSTGTFKHLGVNTSQIFLFSGILLYFLSTMRERIAVLDPSNTLCVTARFTESNCFLRISLFLSTMNFTGSLTK